MKKNDSLSTLGGTANVPSTKNFSLVKMAPPRKAHFGGVSGTQENKSSAKADSETSQSEEVTSTNDSSKSENDSGSSSPSGPSSSPEEPYMQFGRLSKNTFCCRFKEPISMVTAFMIALSRFDTAQKYL
jgi:hypothetical protein